MSIICTCLCWGLLLAVPMRGCWCAVKQRRYRERCSTSFATTTPLVSFGVYVLLVLCVCTPVYLTHVGVLLMDESGAVGLDLSCASHVFLMEPVLETDLEQQIVARAWRLGNGQAHGNTKPPVSVTTYAMGGGSIEEAMLTRALPARELKEVYGEILMGLQRVKV